MPPDLSISAITGSATAQPSAQPATAPPSQAGPAPPPPNPGPQFPNPSLRLDHGLGMVVIEFRDPRGEVTRSIPSQRQIDAYRSHQIDTLPGLSPAEPAAPQAEDAPKPVKSDAQDAPKDTA